MSTASDFADLVQFAGLEQAVEAGEDRVEEVQQQQSGVLVEEEAAVVGLVVSGARVAQTRQQGQDHVEVLEALQVFGFDRSFCLASHAKAPRPSGFLGETLAFLRHWFLN